MGLLKQLARGVATQFGGSYEVVVHNLAWSDLDSSIVYIGNGHVSNRQLGDGPSETVLETLNNSPEWLQDKLSYLTRAGDGCILKSSIMCVRGDDTRVNYIFSLNYDITGLITMDKALEDLTSTNSEPDKQPRKITHNVNDLLDTLIGQSVTLVGRPVALMTKNDKVTTVQFLSGSGAFLIIKPGDKVSSYFRVSRFTLYSYMDSGRESKDTENNE